MSMLQCLRLQYREYKYKQRCVPSIHLLGRKSQSPDGFWCIAREAGKHLYVNWGGILSAFLKFIN